MVIRFITLLGIFTIYVRVYAGYGTMVIKRRNLTSSRDRRKAVRVKLLKRSVVVFLVFRRQVSYRSRNELQ